MTWWGSLVRVQSRLPNLQALPALATQAPANKRVFFVGSKKKYANSIPLHPLLAVRPVCARTGLKRLRAHYQAMPMNLGDGGVTQSGFWRQELCLGGAAKLMRRKKAPCWRCASVSLRPCQPDFFKARSRALMPSWSGSRHLAKYECTVRHLGNSLGKNLHWHPVRSRYSTAQNIS